MHFLKLSFVVVAGFVVVCFFGVFFFLNTLVFVRYSCVASAFSYKFDKEVLETWTDRKSKRTREIIRSVTDWRSLLWDCPAELSFSFKILGVVWSGAAVNPPPPPPPSPPTSPPITSHLSTPSASTEIRVILAPLLPVGYVSHFTRVKCARCTRVLSRWKSTCSVSAQPLIKILLGLVSDQAIRPTPPPPPLGVDRESGEITPGKPTLSSKRSRWEDYTTRGAV